MSESTSVPDRPLPRATGPWTSAALPLVASAVMLLLAPGPKLSVALETPNQEATDAEGAPRESSAAGETLVESLVVTAQKREERLSEVPASLVVIDSNVISATGVVQVQDLTELAPNFQLPDQGADFQARATIRGVGANSRNIGFDTRVGVYLDGVYLGQSPAVNFGLLDLERVEVLRGPQGTLYGKNSVAGALNLVTRAPSPTLSGNVRLTAGEFESRGASALLNTPLSKKAFARFSVLHDQRDGYTLNTFTGTELVDQDSTAYRGQLLILPSERTSIRVSADKLASDRLIAIGEAITDTFALVPVVTPAYETAFDIDPREERDLTGTAVSAESVRGRGHTIRSITGYRDSILDLDTDVDYSVFDFAVVDYRDRYKQLSQELQWISPLKGKLSYVLGAYLYQQKATTRRDVPLGQDIVLLGPPEVTGLEPGNVIANSGTVDTESYALFGELEHRSSARSTLNLGLRATYEKKKVDWVLDGSQSGIFGIGSTDIDDDRSATNLSPAVSWIFRASNSVNVYVRGATGFKSGGFNLDFVAPADIQAGIEFDDETVLSFEVGAKVQAAGGRLLLNFALFTASYDDYQVNQFLDLGGGATSITIRNAAEVMTRGAEVDLAYRGRTGVEIDAALALLDTEFTKFPGGGVGGSDASGNELPFAPRSSFSLGVGKTWILRGSARVLVGRVDYAHASSQFTTVSNVTEQPLAFGGTVPYGLLDSYDLIGGRFGYISKGGKFEAYLWGRNLTDERYLVNSFRDFFGVVVQLNSLPRTFGVEVVFNF